MATPTHRELAETRLAEALAYPITSPTRAMILAEAQVHASLADPVAPRATRSPAKPAAPKEASE